MDNFDGSQPYTIEEYQPANGGQPQYVDPNAPGYIIPATEETVVTKRKIPFLAIIIVFILIGLLIFGYLLIKANQQPNNPGSTNTNNDTTTDSDKKVVLQWWGLYLDEDIVKPLIEEYQDLHPNVTIEYADKRPQGPYEEALKEYQNELNRVLSSGDPVQQPDIFMVHNTWAPDYETYSRPAPSYTFSQYSEDFYPAVVEDFAGSGQVYGIPMWLDSLAIIYNKVLLESKSLTVPPDRWQEFKNLAESLTVKNGNTFEQGGFASGNSTNTTFAFELLNLLMVQNGVQMTDTDHSPIFSQNPDSVEAFEFFKSFLTSSDATWNASFKNDSVEFLEGDLAMVAATSWRLREILRYNDQLNLDLEIGIAQVPQLDGQTQPVMNWADYYGNMVALSRPNTAQSWEFLEWLSQPDQYKKLSQNVKQTSGYFGIVYPRKDMSNELLGDQYLNVYNESAPNAKTWYMVKGLQVKDLFKDIINNSGVTASGFASLEDDIKDLMLKKGQLEQNELEEE